MKEKIKCLYSKCENEFVPKNTKTKFCCASHRVMWHRENGEPKTETKVQDLNEYTGNKEAKPTKTTNTTIDTRKPFMSEAIKKKLGL